MDVLASLPPTVLDILMGCSLLCWLLRLFKKVKFFGIAASVGNLFTLILLAFFMAASDGIAIRNSFVGFLPLLYVPISFAVLELFTHRYCYSLFTLLSCIYGSLYGNPFSWRLTAGLVLALVGDFFMARKKSSKGYIPGIAFFLLAHLAYLWHSIWYVGNCRYGYRLLSHADAIVIGIVLLAGLIAYVALRIAPKLDKVLLIPVSAYMLVSAVSLAASSMTVVLYGVAPLVVSDLMIAENDFAGNKKCGPLIMPLYFLSQIMLMLTLY